MFLELPEAPGENLEPVVPSIYTENKREFQETAGINPFLSFMNGKKIESQIN